jgi:hypothetical protein
VTLILFRVDVTSVVHLLDFNKRIRSSIYSRILTQLSIAFLQYGVLSVFHTEAGLQKIIRADCLRTTA